MLQRRLLPSESRNQSGLTRNNIHVITKVVPIDSPNIIRYPTNILTCAEISQVQIFVLKS